MLSQLLRSFQVPNSLKDKGKVQQSSSRKVQMTALVSTPSLSPLSALTHLGHRTGLPSPHHKYIARGCCRCHGDSHCGGCIRCTGGPASPGGSCRTKDKLGEVRAWPGDRDGSPSQLPVPYSHALCRLAAVAVLFMTARKTDS